MYRFKTLAFTLLLTSLAISPAYAKRHGWDDSFAQEGNQNGQIERLKHKLDLSPQQATELKRIHAESKHETASLREKAKTNREEIRIIFDAENLDEMRLRELTNKQAERHADMMIEKHAIREKINQILTPEQQEKHKEFRQQRSKDKRQRRCEEPAAGKTTNI